MMGSVRMRVAVGVAVGVVHHGEGIVAVRSRDGRRNSRSCIGVRAGSRGRLAAMAGSRRRSGGNNQAMRMRQTVKNRQFAAICNEISAIRNQTKINDLYHASPRRFVLIPT